MHTSSPCTSSTRFCAHRTRPTALLFRALKASAPAILACMATSDQAAAGSTSSRPQRVQQVLQYVQEHPLTVTSQHMQYDAEPSTPLPACIEGLTPADVLPPGTPADAHIGRVIAGLLYVACGGLDHAHNLITPLCWGSWTAYSGNPIPNSPVSSEAAYVHAIVHRQEGHCIGEFGSGFSNANYWYRSAGEHPIAVPLLKEAQRLAAGSPACRAHMKKHNSNWDPCKFVGLCNEVARSNDPELKAFCDKVMAAELRLLLDYCYDKC